MQDDGTLNNNAYPPSFIGNSCTLNMTLKANAGAASYPFYLNSQLLSPNSSLVMSSYLPFSSNASCVTLAYKNSLTENLNGFYEGSSKTTSTAYLTDTYLTNEYNCAPDSNNLISYNAYTAKDSNGLYPYAYSYVGAAACSLPATSCEGTASALANVISLIQNGVNSDCGSSLSPSKQYNDAASTTNCDPVSVSTLERTIFVRFNSMYIGAVNISINGLEFVNTAAGSATWVDTYSYWLYNEKTNTSVQLSTSAPPYSIERLLNPNEEYWLIMYRCSKMTTVSGHVQYKNNADNYTISINAYEPALSCGNFSSCENGYQTRTCTDLNGIAGDVMDIQECFETPTVEVELGFEDFISGADDTFLCGKTWLICSDLLQTKESSLPYGWYIDRTYATTWLGETAALENFCEGSAETAFSGSKSLKCWSLPPSDGQPLPINSLLGDDVVCGDYNQTREPEVIGLFNESLFIAYNVSFATPYVNLHWATKKCSSAPIQYKYGDCLGCCGDKCYGDCNQTPTGWYTIKMADIGTGIQGYQKHPYTAMRYSPYLDPTVLNYTESASNADSDTTIINLNYWEEGEYSTLELTTGNFTEDMTIAFRVLPYFGSTDAPVYLTDVTGTIIYGYFTLPSSIFTWVWRNVTLQNVTGLFGEGTNIIYIHEPIDNNPASISFYVDYIAIETYQDFVYVDTLFEFDEEATTDWSEKMLDLTNIGIVPNHNYTIGFKISPQYETTASNCLFFDDVKGTYTESTVSVCSSH
jgi:hypothetical protein